MTALQAAAAAGSDLAPSRPAAANGSSRSWPAWPSCTEPEPVQPELTEREGKAGVRAGWTSLLHAKPTPSSWRNDFSGGIYCLFPNQAEDGPRHQERNPNLSLCTSVQEKKRGGGGTKEDKGVWKWLYNSHQDRLHVSTAFSGLENRAPTTPDQHLHLLKNVRTKATSSFCCRNPAFSRTFVSHRSG